MSEQIRLNMTRIGIVVAILGGLAGLISAGMAVPNAIATHGRDIASHDVRISSLERQLAESRELLVRIDENVKALKANHSR